MSKSMGEHGCFRVVCMEQLLGVFLLADISKPKRFDEFCTGGPTVICVEWVRTAVSSTLATFFVNWTCYALPSASLDRESEYDLV